MPSGHGTVTSNMKSCLSDSPMLRLASKATSTRSLPRSSSSLYCVFGRHSDLYERPRQPDVEAVRWVLDQLRKHELFANLKKCRFYQDEIRLLGYVIISQGVWMTDERIEAAKHWTEAKPVRDIEVFANFYQSFIRSFSRIAAPLTSMLKTTWAASTNSSPASVRMLLRADDEVAKKLVFVSHASPKAPGRIKKLPGSRS